MNTYMDAQAGDTVDLNSVKTNDIAFSLRNDKYKVVIEKCFSNLHKEIGCVGNWKNNKAVVRAEASKVLDDLKRDAGRLLMPIHEGKGNSRIVEYEILGEEEALKSKLSLSCFISMQ